MDYNPFSLRGKDILVTGASSGIGRSIAIICAKMGATLYITGRNMRRLEETLLMMPAGNHKLISADLTDVADIERLVAELPRLHGIAHCAGVGSRVLCKNIRKEDYEHIMISNLEAPILLQSSILAKKKIEKCASILFVASKAADYPTVGNALYSASKGALISYAKCLATELAPRKIRVNTISPAMIWTNLIFMEGMSKEEMEEAEKQYPLKRYGQPEDVANLAVYLLSDASVWMTGTDIDITGGTLKL